MTPWEDDYLLFTNSIGCDQNSLDPYAPDDDDVMGQAAYRRHGSRRAGKHEEDDDDE